MRTLIGDDDLCWGQSAELLLVSAGSSCWSVSVRLSGCDVIIMICERRGGGAVRMSVSV